MKSRIRLLISGVLIGWLAWQMNWTQVGQAFAHLRLQWWLAAVGLLIALQMVSAVRWRSLAGTLGVARPLRQMMGFYFIGMYFNLLLPTSVGGDVVRAWYLNHEPGQRMRAFVSIFLDRLSGLWVLMALACLGVLLSPLSLAEWVRGSVWFCAGSGVLATALLPVLIRHRKWVPWKFGHALEALATVPSPWVLVGPILLSIIVQAGNVAIVWLIGLALDAPVPASSYWIVVPLVTLLTMLPVSINGMGVREGAMVLLLAPLAVTQETAITLAFLWFTVQLAVSLLGGLVYLFGRFSGPPRSQISVWEQGATAEEGQGNDGSVGSNSDQGRTRQSKTAA